MKKSALYTGAALLALATTSPVATAQNGIPEGLNDQVRALQAEGWTVTEVEKTFWGRWVIEAEKDGQEREVVMSGDGERVIRNHTENEANDDETNSSSGGANEVDDDETDSSSTNESDDGETDDSSSGGSGSDNESDDDESDDSGSDEVDDDEPDDNETDDSESNDDESDDD